MAVNDPGTLIPVQWAGTDWNQGDLPNGLCTYVTDVNGWDDTPVFNGNDVALALTDGVLQGNKLIAQREVTLTGIIAGARAPLLAYARQLAQLASARASQTLSIGMLDETSTSLSFLTAQVRADNNSLQFAWLGRYGFQWTVTLTAPDPLLYSSVINSATLTAPSGATGRTYPKTYQWHYPAQSVSNEAQMVNAGTAAAPVTATFTGPLASPQISDGTRSIFLKTLGAGEVVTVNTGTLVAIAPGGATRASYVLAGSVPMTIPAQSAPSWSLYTTGTGSVKLTWQSAWS